MDQFVSTYRKDYSWPYVRTMALRKGPTNVSYATNVRSEGNSCKCKLTPRDVKMPKKHVDQLESETYEWSRIGPMGPLLDPKLYPAKTGPGPESEATRFGQPDTYLKKLEQKYPYLYGVLQTAPPDEMIRKVDADRLRSTYQVDYSDMAERPAKHRDELLEAAGMDGLHLEPCAPEKPPTKVDSRTQIRVPLLKRLRPTYYPAGKQNGFRRKGKRKPEEDAGESRIPTWKSEYQDGINRTGQAIMRHKVHHAKDKSMPVWAMAF